MSGSVKMHTLMLYPTDMGRYGGKYMSELTSSPWLPTTCGLRLRELREAKGMSRYALAHRLAMSDDQLRQIEANESSLFYSEAIRVTAIRKIADFLGEQRQFPPAVESSVLMALVESIAPVNSTPPHRTHWLRFFLGPQSLRRAVLLGACATVVITMWVKDAGKILQTERPEAGVIKSPTFAAPAYAESVQDDYAFCDKAQGPVAAFTPSKSTKDGDVVYVVGSPGQHVCLKDSRGHAWRHEFTIASGRSFYGRPPWLVESPQLGALQVYFQGVQARSPQPGGMRMRLIASDRV